MLLIFFAHKIAFRQAHFLFADILETFFHIFLCLFVNRDILFAVLDDDAFVAAADTLSAEVIDRIVGSVGLGFDSTDASGAGLTHLYIEDTAFAVAAGNGVCTGSDTSDGVDANTLAAVGSGCGGDI